MTTVFRTGQLFSNQSIILSYLVHSGHRVKTIKITTCLLRQQHFLFCFLVDLWFHYGLFTSLTEIGDLALHMLESHCQNPHDYCIHLYLCLFFVFCVHCVQQNHRHTSYYIAEEFSLFIRIKFY